MLLDYIQAAMGKAKYEILPEDGTFYGNIAECRGVWANAASLQECRTELQEVLEDWILIKVRHGDNDLPVIDGIDINLPPAREEVA